jgi:lipopolysaccharide export system permease protein
MILISIDAIFSYLAQLDDLTNDYQAWQALAYIGLGMPERIYLYTPVAVLLGCLIGLGQLASSSELVVMRSAAVSILRIVWAVTKPVLAVMLLGLVLGQYIAPYTSQLAESQRALQQQSGNLAKLTQKGQWRREGNSFIHINLVQPNGVLYGISRYQFNDHHQLIAASFAERAVYRGGHWLLFNIVSTRFDQQHTRYVHQDKQIWQTAMTPKLLAVAVMGPGQLSITGLYQYAGYLEEQGLNAGPYQLEFWHKTLRPLGTLAMVVLALSCIFGPLRSVTIGIRIVVGSVIGLSYHFSQELLSPASLVFGFPPIIAVIVPILLCFSLAWYLLKRVG